jgi:hypothetical protein
MSMRMRWKAGFFTLCGLFLLAFGTGHGHSQPGDVPPIPRIDIPGPPQAATPTPAPTVEDLIARVESLRKQQAELQKQEQAVVEQLKARLKQQEERLSKLGVAVNPPAQKVGPTIHD